MLYDLDCGMCTGVARALVRLDSAAGLTMEPLQALDSSVGPSRDDLERVLHVVDSEGHWSTGGRAVIAIAKRVPALRPIALVARVPGAGTVMDIGYRLVADNRHELSALLGLRSCPVPKRGPGRPKTASSSWGQPGRR